MSFRRQQTTLGPHRDVMVFTLKGRDVEDFWFSKDNSDVVLAWEMQWSKSREISLDPTPLIAC
jgi:hypothetical protein